MKAHESASTEQAGLVKDCGATVRLYSQRAAEVRPLTCEEPATPTPYFDQGNGDLVYEVIAVAHEATVRLRLHYAAGP